MCAPARVRACVRGQEFRSITFLSSVFFCVHVFYVFFFVGQEFRSITFSLPEAEVDFFFSQIDAGDEGGKGGGRGLRQTDRQASR